MTYNSPDRKQIRNPDRYLQTAIAEEFRRVENAPAGTRNNTLNESSLRIGQLVGAGVVDRQMAKSVLHEAARKCGLSSPEAFATIESGLKAGERSPRQLGTHTPPHSPCPDGRRPLEANGGLYHKSHTAKQTHLTDDEQRKRKHADEFLRASRPVPGTLAQTYLESRGL